MNRRLSLIVFDWDGTLMDSEQNIVTSMQQAFEASSLPPPTAANVRQVIGLALDRAIMALLPEGQSHKLEKVEAAYRKCFRLFAAPSPLFEQTRAVLDQLIQHEYVLAVATGKSRAGLERAIAESDLQGIFTATRCADQCRSKPAPDMLEELLFETGFEASDALMIGDTTYDLEMANRAGTHAAAACYGAHSLTQLQIFEPAFLLDDIAELPEKLRRFEAD